MLGKKGEYSHPASLAEVKDILNKRAAEPDFGYEQQTCLDYANKFCKLKASDAEQMKQKLVQIEGVGEEAAAKIVDILPQRQSTLQVILAKEKTTVDEKALAAIFSLVGQYSKKAITPPPVRLDGEQKEAPVVEEDASPAQKTKKKD